MFDEDTIELAAGRHERDSGQASFLEAVSYFAGEAWSDHPECVSPLIAVFARTWNDALPDADRTRLLRPYVRRVAGTRCAVDLSELGVLAAFVNEEEMRDVPCMPPDCTRAWMCADWLVRTYARAWSRLAGQDTRKPDALPELTAGLEGYERSPNIPVSAVIITAIRSEQRQIEPSEHWLDMTTWASRAADAAGGRAAEDAFAAVPTLAPGAPDTQIADIVRVATASALAGMEAVVKEAARKAGWSDHLEAERRATFAMAREAARRARQEVERTASAQVRRAARDTKRAAERTKGDTKRFSRGSAEDATRRSAEEAARRTIGRTTGPYAWFRAKTAGRAAVRDSRNAMGEYAPRSIRDAARSAVERAYREIEHTAHWQPTLAAAQAAAEQALAPTIADIQDSASDLLDRLIRV